jgi:prepilin-type N-terminal cleavage/methylation domain-containing protein
VTLANSWKSARVRGGFTLVELLVVIGIIVLLIGILLPVISAVRRSAEKNAGRLDLQTIGLALEAYRKDFGDYPRPPDSHRKYRVLAWALIGPYDTTASGANDPLSNPPNQPLVDGADGPGFRTSYALVSGQPKGSKVFGPYLPPDKFKINPSTNADFPTTPADLRWDILDRFGTPIEYFPRWRQGQGLQLFGTDPASAAKATYDYQQQWQASPASTPSAQSQAIKYLRKALGDIGDNAGAYPPNDKFDGSEAPTDAPAFILVSRGISRTFSDDTTIKTKFSKCEEITNLQH